MPQASSRLPAAFMVLGSISSIQIGAALATFMFEQVGVSGTVFLRNAVGAVILAFIWRPTLRLPRSQLWLVFLYGLSLAGVTLAFYGAVARLPLGTAVTLEFIGPLTVALITSRRRLDIIWAVMAAAGVVLLVGGVEGESLDVLGIVLALVAAFFWGAYILVGTRLGVDSGDNSLLSLGLVIAALICLPPGAIEGGLDLVSPSVLAVGLAVGLLSAAIPFALEFEAMRRLPSSVFGVMMSLEPAMAALVGFIILGQTVGLIQAAAIALVVAASVGALRSAGGPAQVEP